MEQCPTCSAQFNLFIRRHHCRNCGGIFCSNCVSFTIFISFCDKTISTPLIIKSKYKIDTVETENKAKLSSQAEVERVCNVCYENVRADVLVFNKNGIGDAVSMPVVLLSLFSICFSFLFSLFSFLFSLFSFLFILCLLFERVYISRWKLLIGRIRKGRAQDGEVVSRVLQGVPEPIRPDLWKSLCDYKRSVQYSV